MSDAISSSGDYPDNESSDKNCSNSSASNNSNNVASKNDDDSSSDSNNKNDDEFNKQDSKNPFGTISSSDDKADNEAEVEESGFFPAPKFKFKPTRSFRDYASFFSDSTATVSQSNGSTGNAFSISGSSSSWGEGSINFVSLDKKNIGQMKMPENIRKLEEAKAKAGVASIAGSASVPFSDNISSSSDTKDNNTDDHNFTTHFRNGSSSSTGATNSTTSNFILFGQNFDERVSSQADGFKASSDLISFSDISNSEQKLQKKNDSRSQSPSDESDSKINSTNEVKESVGESSKNYFLSCLEGDAFGFCDPPEKEESEAIRSLKRSYEVISGEESEETVMTVPGTLYVWNSDNSTWIGKGKGNFKLNDSKECGNGAYSRLIVRSLGVHKVLLNARLVLGMNVNLANETAIRFATVEGLHLFKSKKKLDYLLELINTRIAKINKRKKEDESSEAEAV